MSAVRVLVVEDEEVAGEAHRLYVDRTPGFTCVGLARTLREASTLLTAAGPDGIDLVLLDLNLPDGHGLDLVRALRAAGHRVDVMAVTSARDLAVVRGAVSQGVVQYLLKPFTAAALRERLERYAAYRASLDSRREAVGQQEVDRLLAGPRAPAVLALPKGISQDSLDAVVSALRASGSPRSAAEVASSIGTSRVTARRYLEFLAEGGQVLRSQRYGGAAGRPEVEYRWRA